MWDLYSRSRHVVWSPHHVGKIMQIQRFTKCLLCLKDVLYRDRLERLGLETLEMRRLRQDLVFTYKVIFRLVSDSHNELFVMSNSSISTRDHAYKLFQRYSHLDFCEHFFAERIMKPWNSLSANNATFKSLTTSKSFVNSVNLTNFGSLGF